MNMNDNLTKGIGLMRHIGFGRFSVYVLSALCVLFVPSTKTIAQSDNSVRVLIVTAHPDDETAFAGSVYKITHDMHGRVDYALITNGEGGYKYSTLAEAYYGLELTDEKVGREYLPTIRKQELMNAGKILGVRNYYFFDQKDHRYTINPHEALDSIWDVPLIQQRLHDILIVGQYDYIFCLLPTDSTHGHHKGATIMALTAVSKLPDGVKRPVVLGVEDSRKSDTILKHYNGLADYPITIPNKTAPIFHFDRSVKFGYHDVLSYKMIVNWEIAEHKSQGTMQMDLNGADLENFYFFALNDVAKIEKTRAFFAELAVLHYPKKTY
jgi:LmbE family N-acetylglucosaminyl deacetylase